MSSHGYGYNGNIWMYLLFGGIVTIATVIFSFLVNLKRKKNRDEVPGSIQNTGEAIVEFLINLIEPVLGEELVQAVLPLLGTFFIFILFSNLLLILPTPLSNPPTGDISVTAALAFICVIGLQCYNFFIINNPKKAFKLWLNPVPSLGLDESSNGDEKENGKNIGKLLFEFAKGIPIKILILIFIILKVIDNLARFLSLSLRLFGNIYGEHTILAQTTEIALTKPTLIITLFIPLLILCFDILVALIQAVVFTNLSLFYMKEEWGIHND